jgi:LysR family transcriptional regulator, benzoate and cis,cis-muconate-responsive activator of ben and cat genes
MDLRHLRAFAAVADSHSFSKAARQLHVAQPPLSRHIRQLENEIGVKLFLRTTTGVQLTREGTLLLEKARTVLAEAGGFLELAGRAKSGMTSIVKVGIARGLAEVVNAVRVHLLGRNPEVSIEGLDIDSSRQYEALRQRTIDIAVLRHVDDHVGVEFEALFEERFVVVLSDHHPLARRRSLRLRQIADEPLLLHERSWAPLAYDKILALYAKASVVPNLITLHASPGDQASMLAVAAGEGICLALKSAVSRSFVPVSGVAVCPLDEPDAVLQVLVAWRKGETSRIVQQFLQSAREVFPAKGDDARASAR